MPRQTRFLASLLLVLGLLAQALPAAQIALAQVQDGATMTVLKGQVAVVHPDGTAVQPAPSGTTVQSGDEIRTLTKAGALITFYTGTEIEMGADTILLVERVSRDGTKVDISLKQVLGSTLNRVQTLSDPGSSYRIEAGGATAVVRGTTFMLVGPVATSQGNIAALVCLDDCDGRTTFAGCATSPYTAFGVTVERGKVTSGCDTSAVSKGADYFNAGFEAITTFEQSFAAGNGVDNPGGVNLGREEGDRKADERRAEEQKEDRPNTIINPCAVGGGGAAPTSTPTLIPFSASVLEGDSGTASLVFPVVLLPAASGTVTVNFSTSGITATPGVDFTAVSGTLTFPAGSTLQNIVVPVIGDTSVEGNELLRVNLSGASGATIGLASAIGTIVDDDGPVTLTVIGASTFEGDTGTRNLTYQGLLNHPSASPVSVTFTTSVTLSTATSGTDFTPTTGTLTIPAGQTSGSFSVPIIGDTAVEPNETVVVQFGTPTGATLATPTATGTIIDDDGPATIAVTGSSTHEGCEGHTSLPFTIQLSHPLGTTASVNFATADGTADSDEDYDATSGTVTFAPGQTSVTVNVLVDGDTAPEPDETVLLNLSNASGATISVPQATGIILNDD
jgi:hypothetical protein